MSHRPVYAVASAAVAPSGFSVPAIWEGIAAGNSAVEKHISRHGGLEYWGARFSAAQREDLFRKDSHQHLIPFERLAFRAASDALQQLQGPPDPARTLFILSTTKGGIGHLDKMPDARLMLHRSALEVGAALGLIHNVPQVISHACISGVAALMFGLRALQDSSCDTAVVVGADCLSEFVLTGFQSFQAIAPERCRPFDKDRKGINLGEGAAAIILSTAQNNPPLARLYSAATSNDANHISGPSRTGQELALAITRSLQDAGITSADIGAISAHGTATLYNDEMESKAFAYSGVQHAPLHSVKGCTGHTLGAAGVLESALLIESLRRGELLPSVGYKTHGVSEPLNVTTARVKSAIRYALKTASGFGGCNAASVWGNEVDTLIR